LSEKPESDATKRILFLCAHPDDVEAHAGGAVSDWTAQGYSVRFVFFTSGDKGSDDPATDPQALMQQREDEQRWAATILGVSDVEFLRFADGSLATIPALLAS